MDARAGLLFEVSWEVCNKVGGIYTVVKSKVPHMVAAYRQNYLLIGPYFPKKAHGEFVEEVPPSDVKAAFDELKGQGIECHYGTWLVPAKPKAILIDFNSFTIRTNDIKKELWERFRIDSLGTQFYDFDQPVVWAYVCGMLIERLARARQGVVAQFHEWLAGAGLLYLKSRNVPVGTVFTTHATILGRSIASSGGQLYEHLDSFKPEEEAKRLGIAAKFGTERAAAKAAEVFSTVSEITGLEATKLLGRKPDVLLLNGLDISHYPGFEKTEMKHELFKRKYKEFVISYFFPYYKFPLDDTILLFIAGRHELRDKGIDVFTRALSFLNASLRDAGSKKTVVAFYFVQGNARAIKPSILEGMTAFKDIRDEIFDNESMIRERMIYDLFSGVPIEGKRILGDQAFFDIQRKLVRFGMEGTPPLCTHELYDEEQDDILNGIKQAGLLNREEDRVKVVYYPVFLSGADQLLDLGYEEAIMGCHLGVFPSYYEPWGYTPLETGALGVSAVTTDLAGFGRFIEKQRESGEPDGIFVLKRLGRSDDDVIAQLAAIMRELVDMTSQERIHSRLAAKQLAALADWSKLAVRYIEAHNKALEKAKG